MTPTDLAQEQLEAYNQRDLARFIACYSDDVESFRLPSMAPVLRGKAAFAEFYARERFCHERLHAELLNRMVLGDTVIDHERIHGVLPEPFEMAVMFVIEDGLIGRVFVIPSKT